MILIFLALQVFVNMIVAVNSLDAFNISFAIIIIAELDYIVTFAFTVVIKSFYPWVYTAPHYMAIPTQARRKQIFYWVYSFAVTISLFANFLAFG